MIGKKTFTGLAVGATMLTGAATVDVVPREAPFVQAYQYKVSEFQKTVTVQTATGTQTITNDQPTFKDNDRNGLISVKMSYDKLGRRVYEQIDDATYANMGKKGGAVYNTPVKYSITLAEAALEAAITPAEAAIAFDSHYGNWYFVGTSGTRALTTSGSDRIVLAMFDNEGGPDDFTSVTYNGVALTEIGTRVQEGTTGRYSHTYALIAPAIGSNNMVINRSSSNQVNYILQAYNGVSQTALPSVTANKQIAAPIGTATSNLTTTVDNSWVLLFARGGRVQTAAAGSTLRSDGGTIATVYSNGPVTPTANVSMAFTQSPDNTAVCTQMFQLEPASAAGGSTISPIIQPQIVWW